MKSVLKTLKILFLVCSGLYILLFIVFFFDLDGKALFYGVEPFLKNHYDNMKRKDPLDQVYSTDTPNYEYH
ncbi:MAG: hypothetical protein J6S26_03140 [Solobacterium sp.]|nr:hypothetical protein [Solobacterium sp.]